MENDEGITQMRTRSEPNAFRTTDPLFLCHLLPLLTAFVAFPKFGVPRKQTKKVSHIAFNSFVSTLYSSTPTSSQERKPCKK